MKLAILDAAQGVGFRTRVVREKLVYLLKPREEQQGTTEGGINSLVSLCIS